MPSGNKVLASVNQRRGQRSSLDIQVYVSKKTPTEGLCGSLDDNPHNDVKHRVTGDTAGAVNIYGHNELRYIINATVGDSWRYSVIRVYRPPA